MADIWQAKTYTKFLDARTRPAKDLLSAIPTSFKPTCVYDLGCGPGNSTILLKDHWPEAKIVGLDSSEDMLREAKSTYPDLEFMVADIAKFSPQETPDCIFANASLQWLGNHDTLIPKLLDFLPSGGILAIQIPNNFHYPAHQITLELLESNPPWKHIISEIAATLRYGRLTKPFYDSAWYYDLYSAANVTQIQLWETEYVQEMQNHEAILQWIQGTGLRPVLSQLNEIDRKQFEKLYVEALKKVYVARGNGKVLFSFRRFFMMAVK